MESAIFKRLLLTV